MQSQSSKRWGEQQEEDMSATELLAKKDQQIRRLQGILEWQRRRAEHANHMLQLNKKVADQSEQTSEGLKSEIARRIAAEEEVRRLKKQNEQLQEGIKKYVQMLKIQLQQKKQVLYNFPQSAQHQ